MPDSRGIHFRDWDNYRKTLSLAHSLKKYGIYDSVKAYWHSAVDFLVLTADDCPTILSAMHQLTLLICGNMSKYYSNDMIGIMIEHGLRFCAACHVHVRAIDVIDACGM